VRNDQQLEAFTAGRPGKNQVLSEVPVNRELPIELQQAAALPEVKRLLGTLRAVGC
jgi:hypothetical protein